MMVYQQIAAGVRDYRDYQRALGCLPADPREETVCTFFDHEMHSKEGAVRGWRKGIGGVETIEQAQLHNKESLPIVSSGKWQPAQGVRPCGAIFAHRRSRRNRMRPNGLKKR